MLQLDITRFYTIGHRGTEIQAVENSLKAFEIATQLHLDFAELDIQCTKDGQVIVFHDDYLNKKTSLKGKIKHHPFSKIKHTLISTQAGSESIPTLEEVFDFLKDKPLKLIIELKAKKTIQCLLDLVEKFNLENKIIVDSFNPSWLRSLQQLNDRISLSLLIPHKLKSYSNQKQRSKIINLIKKNRFIGASFHVKNLNSELIKEFHANGLAIFAWGVKKIEIYEELYKSGINGFTAPDPALLIEIHKKHNSISSL